MNHYALANFLFLDKCVYISDLSEKWKAIEVSELKSD